MLRLVALLITPALLLEGHRARILRLHGARRTR
jgi:hypothetical protein